MLYSLAALGLGIMIGAFLCAYIEVEPPGVFFLGLILLVIGYLK